MYQHASQLSPMSPISAGSGSNEGVYSHSPYSPSVPSVPSGQSGQSGQSGHGAINSFNQNQNSYTPTTQTLAVTLNVPVPIDPNRVQTVGKRPKIYEGAELMDKNYQQFANIKLITLISFGIILMVQGVYCFYYADLFLLSFRLYQDNDTNCEDNAFFTKTDYLISGATGNVEEMCGFAIMEGFIWLAFGSFLCQWCMKRWLRYRTQLHKEEYESTTQFNYALLHCMACPLFSIIVGFSQGFILGMSSADDITYLILKENDIAESKYDYYYQQVMDDDGCGAFNDLYDKALGLLVCTNLAYYSIYIYGLIIPLIITCMYMVRGKVVFYDNEKYHCLVYCRPCRECGQAQCCLYLDTICCIADEAPERLDKTLQRYTQEDQKF